MGGFSPFTRRLVALALLFFLTVGSLQLAVLPLFSLVGSELTRLTDARFRLARLEALQARPAPLKKQPLAPGLYLTAANQVEAVTQIKGHLARLAATSQTKIDKIGTADAATTVQQSLALSFSASGGEQQLLGFLTQLEQGAPTMRLRSWRLSRRPVGQAQEVQAGLAVAPSVTAGSSLAGSNMTVPPVVDPAAPQTNVLPVLPPGAPGPELIMEGVLLFVWERPV